jgi:1-acyl-sn-glycerol-3-phosphate acyltransferase
MDVEVQFGEPLEFTEASNRKQVSQRVEERVRAMMADTLRHRQRASSGRNS